MKKMIITLLALNAFCRVYAAEKSYGTSRIDKNDVIITYLEQIGERQLNIQQRIRNVEGKIALLTGQTNTLSRILACALGLTNDISEMRALLDKNENGET